MWCATHCECTDHGIIASEYWWIFYLINLRYF
ncbi:unnamed protein product [Strongylus vulgaris]|uniref:Uncharacterized protein n=1 Tax=Strongylus vulgaris TaxID=40348 RepID=A0A3P7JFJ4_STRVU|nr:unnamed protein product [Strongylus vulgaris]